MKSEIAPNNWIDQVSYWVSKILMWVPAFIVAIIFYEVVMRYIFIRPTLWVNEMSLWSAGIVYLCSGLYVMQQREHIRIFIIYDMMPRSIQILMDFISLVGILIFAFAIIWGSFNEALAKLLRWETYGTAWDPPIPATMKPLILIILFLITLQAISNFISDLRTDK